MTEKLYIENFLGIKKLEIEVKKFNIIIGPQASGKSVCAKLLFFFKNFVNFMIRETENNQAKKNLDDLYQETQETFFQCFPPISWGNNVFIIKYQINQHFIEVKYLDSEKVNIVYSDAYEKLFTTFKEVINSNFEEKEISFINTDNDIVRKKLNDHAIYELGRNSIFLQHFIPAGRSFFATLENNIFAFLSSPNSIDPFYKSFGEFYQFIKNIYNRKNIRESNKINSNVNKLIEDILSGTYIYEHGQDLLQISEDRKVKVSNSSSGQQEVLPLTLILSTINFLVPKGGGYTFYIEEPEAHLFPNAQKKLVELMAIVFNEKKSQSQFFITTHSPYILTSLNNLIQAGSLYKNLDENQQKELSKIVPKSQAMDLDDIAVYSLENGKCKSIICEETQLIDTNIIDDVSNDLAIEFDKLLDLI